MKIKVDLHVHTVRSPDAVTTLSEAFAHAKARGLDGIALTDHDVTPALEGENPQGLIVIPGIEVSTRNGHVLGLGILGRVGKPRTARDAVKAVHDQGGIAVLAHPYASILGLRSRWVLEEANFDAVEVVNSGTPFFRLSTFLALGLSRALNLPATAGSDSHIPETVGSSYTVIDSNSLRVSDVLEALRTGRAEPFGSPITLTQRVKKLWLTRHRRFQRAPSSPLQ